MDFNYTVNRDAYATIAGFVLQVDLTLLRWLNLDDAETLELETGEDIDTVGQDIRNSASQRVRLVEQVKRYRGNITLRSPVALETLAHFAEHRSSNPDWRLRFRLLTTAKIGRERDWQGDLEGIALWEAIRVGDLPEDTRDAGVRQLQSFLQQRTAPDGISAEIWDFLQAELRSDAQFNDFINCFEWSTGSDEYLAVEEQVRLGLVQGGFAADQERAHSIADQLFAFVFRTLSGADLKRLTKAQLTAELSRTTQSEADLQLVRFIRSELTDLAERMAQAEGRLSTLEVISTTTQATVASLAGQVIAVVEFVQPTFVHDIPDLVVPAIPREDLVSAVLHALEASTTVCLIGEPGSGKTQLSLRVADSSTRRLVWVDIPRYSTPAQACSVIDSILKSISGVRSGPILSKLYEQIGGALQTSLIVLDNVPRFLQGDPLARRIELLSRFLRPGARLLATSYYPLPRRTRDQADVQEIPTPRFDEAATTKVMVVFGALPAMAKQLTTLIYRATQGLPVLVTAVARFLAEKEWNIDIAEFEAIVKAEFAHSDWADARDILRLTIPDEGTRELLYRLTLVIGGISKAEVERVARVPRPISLPLEKMEQLIGVWLQPFLGDKYIVSPLVDPAVSNLLEERTRKGVNAILAVTIMDRGPISPLDAVACIHHFTLAGLLHEAGFVLASALMALIDAEPDPIADSMVLASVWIAEIPDEIDVNLRLFIRVLQIVAMDNRGRAIDFLLSKFDAELDAGINTWGAAMSTTFLAIRFCKKHPEVANRYLLKYLQMPASIPLPDGEPLSLGETPLIGMLWATAQYAGTDAEVESWIHTVEELTEDQITELGSSPFQEDSASVLCDGIWLRDYRKPSLERDWDRVEDLVRRVQRVGTQNGLTTLEAAAIRTRILILAEWRHDVDGALELARSSLLYLDKDGDAFLLTEVMGRQLAYAGRKAEAIEWLERAHSYAISTHEVWRRNVMVTLAELVGEGDRARAIELAHEAVVLSQTTLMGERLAESYAEEAIAYWNAGDRKASFASLQLAIREGFKNESDTTSWQELFLSLFRVAIYYGSMAHRSCPPQGIESPTQGMFLGTYGLDTARYYPGQKSYIQIRMTMFGEGLREYSDTEPWFEGAMQLAEKFPVAQSIHNYAAFWTAYPLRRDDFREAAHLTVLMADATLASTAESGQSGELTSPFGTPEELAAARHRTALIIGMVPAALRLALLRLRGAQDDSLSQHISRIQEVLAGRPEALLISQALHDALISAMSADDCYARARQLIPQMATVAAGMIYMVGAALKARVPDALSPHIWLAQNVERLFASYPSTHDEIFVPFLETYWRTRAITNGYEFRSGSAFTLKLIEEALRSIPSSRTKTLLRNMDICTPTNLPTDFRAWLTDSAT